MPISQSNYIDLTCPACGARFETDAWALVDAAERSDLAQALRDGSLNVATCPKCGSNRTAPTAQIEDESRQLNLFRCETCHSRFVRSIES